jgi:hypothetical protein
MALLSRHTILVSPEVSGAGVSQPLPVVPRRGLTLQFGGPDGDFRPPQGSSPRAGAPFGVQRPSLPVVPVAGKATEAASNGETT